MLVLVVLAVSSLELRAVRLTSEALLAHVVLVLVVVVIRLPQTLVQHRAQVVQVVELPTPLTENLLMKPSAMTVERVFTILRQVVVAAMRQQVATVLAPQVVQAEMAQMYRRGVLALAQTTSPQVAAVAAQSQVEPLAQVVLQARQVAQAITQQRLVQVAAVVVVLIQLAATVRQAKCL